METCTNCGEEFIKGSSYQKICNKCIVLKNEELVKKLQNLNKEIMGDWNSSVKSDSVATKKLTVFG